MGRDRKEASLEQAERSGDDDSKSRSRSRSRETPVSDRQARETSETLRKKCDSSEYGKSRGKSERRRSRRSSDSEEDTDDRKHGKRRRSRKRYTDSESDDSSSEGSESMSESDYSETETETETEEERRRRKKKERRRREEERERKSKRRKKDKERKRRKEKEEDRKRRKKKENKKKKKKNKEGEGAEKGKTGAVTDSWGKYGIIRETDMWNKRPEFTAWLLEVKQVNLESLPNWEEKQMFKQFMEDHNTATFPLKKYYDLDTFHRHELEKEMKKGMKKVRAVERTVFNDEEQRRQELMVERERHKEEQLNALKREMMQGGMAQAMKEQAQLKEEMQYQYKIGNMEAAAAIQRRLDPNPAV